MMRKVGWIGGLALFLLAGIPMNLARAEIKTETIDYKQGDVELQGVLAYDDAVQGKRPGIAVIHEWWGRGDYETFRAKELAKLGYVAFAIDMYGKGKRTDDPKQAGAWARPFYNDRQLARDRANAGLDVLRENEHVDPNKLGVIGYCFGGMVALEVARGNLDGVLGVVSFHGTLDTPDPAKKINARVLVETGGADPNVPPEQVKKFEKEMKDAGANYQVHVHEGAMHSFTNPESTKRGMKGIGYNEKADKASWENMKTFFKEVFGT